MKINFVIGRLQPMHIGHRNLIHKASEDCDKLIIILGSPQKARDFNNPVLYSERKQIMQEYLDNNLPDVNTSITTTADIMYTPNDDFLWASNIVRAVMDEVGDDYDPLITSLNLFCGEKDSEFYKSVFKSFFDVEICPLKFGSISATDIRNKIISNGRPVSEITSVLTDESAKVMLDHEKSGVLDGMREYYAASVHDKILWSETPWEHHNVATDAVVFSGDQVLIIKRGGDMGKGAWALPGGYLDRGETLLECCVRELQEETGLVFANNNPLYEKVFDNPERSLGHRTITSAYVFAMNINTNLTGLCAADDATEALFVPVKDILSFKYPMYSDHYHIIKYFEGIRA